LPQRSPAPRYLPSFPTRRSSDLLGFERRHNAVARAASADFSSFHAAIRDGLPIAPAYYPHVRALNRVGAAVADRRPLPLLRASRSEEHTSELQSRGHLVCRLLLE